MKKANKGKPTVTVTLDPDPKGEIKALTGADHDDWSLRLVNVVHDALPDHGDADALRGAINAACSGMLDMKPTDPVRRSRLSSQDRLPPCWPQGEGQRRNERQPHAQSSCCTTMQSNIKTKWSALSCACRQRLEGLPHARRSRWSTKGQAEWKLSAWRSDK
jgi:hypothetical protein